MRAVEVHWSAPASHMIQTYSWKITVCNDIVS